MTDPRYDVAVQVFRGLLGWTKAELAEHAGCHESYVSMIESGKRRPSESMLDSMAAAMGVNRWHLFDLAHDRIMDEGTLSEAMLQLALRRVREAADG
ncbi:MAG: helix-turn-helix transcriptional regulator [Phycisphaerales bacterium]|nr:helix-turn-helix transcriptional regulator [Phycisphaerales bacterium]